MMILIALVVHEVQDEAALLCSERFDGCIVTDVYGRTYMDRTGLQYSLLLLSFIAQLHVKMRSQLGSYCDHNRWPIVITIGVLL